MILPVGAIDTSIDVQIVDDAGLGVTGLVAATFPAVSISKGTGADISVSLVDLALITTGHTDGGVKERGGGVYRFDPPDTLASTAAPSVKIRGEASGKHLIAPPVQVGPVPTGNDYPEGFVYIDPVNGTAGTVVGVNGTITNPSSTFTDAAAIATARGRKAIRFAPNALVELLTGSYSEFFVDVNGGGFTIANAASLGSSSIVFSSRPSAELGYRLFVDTELLLQAGCTYENVNLPACKVETYAYVKNCALEGTIRNLNGTGSIPTVFQNCYARNYPAVAAVTFNMGGDGANESFVLLNWYGDISLTNMRAGQKFVVYGYGKLTIASSCTGGTVQHTSHVEITDSSGGLVTQDLVSASDASVIAANAAGVWSYATRTLTTPAAALIASLQGSALTIVRGDTISLSITGLGNITNRSKLWFTVKQRKTDADSAAIIQITELGGLLYLNGAAATAIQGSVTVTDQVAGDLTITLLPTASTLLELSGSLVWDIQVLRSTGAVNTLMEGTAEVQPDTTRAIA